MLLCISYLLFNTENITPKKKNIGRLLAIIVMLMGAFIFIHYLLGTDSYIDFIILSKRMQEDALIRMSSYTAIILFLQGLSLWILDYKTAKGKMPAQALALITGAMGSFLLLSFIYNVTSFVNSYTNSPTSLFSVFFNLLLSFSIFFKHPTGGFAGDITRTRTGSRSALIFLPLATIVPVLIFWVHINYESASTLEGIVVSLILFILLCLFIIYFNLTTINKSMLERKAAEEALEGSLRKVDSLSKLIALSSDSIATMDENFIITSWNKGAEKLYGYTAAEAIGKNKYELLDKSTVSPTEEESRVAIQNEIGEANLQVNRLTKYGKPVSVMVSAVVLKDDKGNITGYAGIGKDITELVEKEKALEAINTTLDEQVQNKTAELNSVYERISDAIASFDAEFNFTYLNKRAESFFKTVVKYEGNLIGKNLWAEFPFLIGTETESAYRHAMILQESVREEIAYPQFNIYTEQTFYPSPQGLSVFLRNITDEKKAEEKQKQAEELYRLIVDTAQEGIAIADENGVLVFVNDYLVKMFKVVDKSNMLGRTVLSFYNEEKQAILKDYLEERKEKTISNFEIEYTAPDDTKVMLSVNSNPLNINGELFGIVAMLSDVTEKKKLEQELVRTNKLFDVLSKATRLLVNLKSRTELFDGVCQLMVSNADIRMAWIGEHHKDTTYVETVGIAGIEGATDYIRSLNIYTNDLIAGNGPTGIAIKTEKPYYCNNYFADNNTRLWHATAKQYGIASSAVFPVFFNDTIFGAFTVYASESNYFQDKEIALINEIVSVISIGMKKLEEEDKRRKGQEDLLQAKEDWELTFNSIPDMIAIIDTEHRIVRANKAMAEKLNLPLCSVEGHKCFTLMHGTNCPIEGCPHAELLKDGKEHVVDIYEKNLGAHINVSTSPMYSTKDGSVLGSVHIVRDISEQRIAEMKIKQLADIIEYSSAFTGIITMDKTFVYMNNAQRRAVGVGLEEDLSALSTAEFISEEERTRLANEVYPVLFEKGIWMGESIWTARGGKEIPIIQVIILHRNDQGEAEYLSTTAIDITEIRHKEGELEKQTMELRALSNKLITIRDEERKMIAKDIHDELGQNLTAIKMDLAWIINHPTAEQEKILEKVATLNKMTTDVIATSRRIYNSLHPKMLDELGLVDTIHWHYNNYIISQNILVEFHTNITESNSFPTGSEHLRLTLFRIYQECMTNMLRYSNATKVLIDLNITGQEIMLRIEDDGIGFEVDQIDTKVHHGLLGMRERVYLLNGTINIDSELGMGTTTTVTFALPKSEIE